MHETLRDGNAEARKRSARGNRLARRWGKAPYRNCKAEMIPVELYLTDDPEKGGMLSNLQSFMFDSTSTDIRQMWKYRQGETDIWSKGVKPRPFRLSKDWDARWKKPEMRRLQPRWTCNTFGLTPNEESYLNQVRVMTYKLDWLGGGCCGVEGIDRYLVNLPVVGSMLLQIYKASCFVFPAWHLGFPAFVIWAVVTELLQALFGCLVPGAAYVYSSNQKPATQALHVVEAYLSLRANIRLSLACDRKSELTTHLARGLQWGKHRKGKRDPDQKYLQRAEKIIEELNWGKEAVIRDTPRKKKWLFP